GRAAATAATPGPVVCRAPFSLAPVARATSASGSTRVESTSQSCPGRSSGKGRLPARQGLSLGAVDRPPYEAGEHLGRADVQVAPDAEPAQPLEDGGAVNGADQGAGQRVADVLAEEVRRGGGDHRGLGLAEVDLVERLAEWLHARGHRLGVEGAGDGEALGS